MGRTRESEGPISGHAPNSERGRGAEAGVKTTEFRRSLEALDLHTNITALRFYAVSNRYTFRQGFVRDKGSRGELRKRREQIVDVILRWCARA